MSLKQKVVITDNKRRNFNFRAVPGIEKFELVVRNESNEENLLAECKDAFALIVDKTKITTKLLNSLDKCQLIIRMGVGYDNIDIKAARAANIDVCNVPDYCLQEVANHVLALFLAFQRRLFEYNYLLKGDNFQWTPFVPSKISRLSKLHVGIVGLGRIGTAFAIKLKCLGVKVSFFDPYKDAGYERVHSLTRYEKLSEMLQAVDVVSIHTPLYKETRGMVDKEFLKQMQPHSLLINTARGGIVKLDDLYAALKDNQIYGACLDVFEQEPINFDHPLNAAWKREDEWLKNRLILTPHAAYYSESSKEDIITKAAQEIFRVAEGRKPLGVVNPASRE